MSELEKEIAMLREKVRLLREISELEGKAKKVEPAPLEVTDLENLMKLLTDKKLRNDRPLIIPNLGGFGAHVCQYPNPWLGTVPPACAICGKHNVPNPLWTTTSTTIDTVGGTNGKPVEVKL